MGHQFEEHEAVPQGIRRIADTILGGAVEALRTGTDEGIHTARTSVKRARALLRFVRPEIGGRRYAKENARLRDAAGALSAARDAFVLVAAFDKLREHAPEALDERLFNDVRALLEARRRGGDDHAGARDTALAALEAARADVARWPLKDDGWDALGKGLRRVYTDGRKRLRKLAEDPEDERWHDLRKRVKDLYYASELLTPIWPSVMEAQADALKKLGDRLGDDHDLTVLRATILREARSLSDEDRRRLFDAVDARRAALRSKAFPLATRFFAEPSGAFVRRLGGLWDAWRTPLPDRLI